MMRSAEKSLSFLLEDMNTESFLDAAKVAEVTGGDLRALDDIAVLAVAIDDREVRPGTLYVPVIGERLNGHDFIESAIGRGAALTLSDHPLSDGIPHIVVENTLAALQHLAAFWKRHYNPITAAVTGSVGKTSTKEMIAAVFAQGFRILKTQGNLNNQTGVPKTVFRINDDTQAAVIELGMNHAGEIDRIARIASPDIGVMTNIGTAHIEYLGSQEGIFKAKSELLPHIKRGGFALVNGDDPFLFRLKREGEFGFPKERVVTYGMADHCDIRAGKIRDCGLDGSDVVIEYANGESFEVHIPAPGRYMVYCALAATGAGLISGLSPEQVRNGIAGYEAAGSRMRVIEGHPRILDDTYNANAPAMLEALRILAKVDGRRVAILGDMKELGEKSTKLHEEVGRAARELGIDLLLTVGTEAKAIQAGAGDLAGYWFATQEDLIGAIANLVEKDDTVLVKASRGMQLEKSVAFLTGMQRD